MAYRPPDYNLLANLWTCSGTSVPGDGPPDWTNVPVQKYIASRSAWPVSPPWANGFFLQYHPPVQLRFPRVPPFDETWPMWPVSAIECPAGSGQYYRAFWYDIQHEGFPNEYALVVAVQCNDELQVIPPPGSTDIVGIGDDVCGNLPPQDAIAPNIPGGLNCCSGSTPPPTDSFLDTFVGMSLDPLSGHIADTGESWTDNFGSMRLNGGGPDAVFDNDDTGFEELATADYTGPGDGTVKMTYTSPGAIGSGPGVGVLFRAIDPDNNWICAVEDAGAGTAYLQLSQGAGGTYTPIASSSVYTPLTSTEYVLEVVLLGAVITCTLRLAGVSQATVGTSSMVGQSDTGVGLWSYRDSITDPTYITRLEKT